MTRSAATSNKSKTKKESLALSPIDTRHHYPTKTHERSEQEDKKGRDNQTSNLSNQYEEQSDEGAYETHVRKIIRREEGIQEAITLRRTRNVRREGSEA